MKAKPISQEQRAGSAKKKSRVCEVEWEGENATKWRRKQNRKKAKFLRNVACTASKNKTFASKTQNVMKEQRKKKELEEQQENF